ncbi:MAG: hypothetical protein Q8P57_02840 [Candidatus Pacearchaeota archaeon]|nr:hypothetical protein [Candidatus Pacearchaeota archaeon]
MSKLPMQMNATSSTRGLLTLAIKIPKRNERDFLILWFNGDKYSIKQKSKKCIG